MDNSSWEVCIQWIVGHGPELCVVIYIGYWFSLVECWINFRIGLWGSHKNRIDHVHKNRMGRARESHGTHTDRMHGNHMGHIQIACTRIAQDAHVGSSMKRKTPVFPSMFFNEWILSRNIQITCMSFKSLDLYSTMLFEAISFRFVRSREP